MFADTLAFLSYHTLHVQEPELGWGAYWDAAFLDVSNVYLSRHA